MEGFPLGMIFLLLLVSYSYSHPYYLRPRNTSGVIKPGRPSKEVTRPRPVRPSKEVTKPAKPGKETIKPTSPSKDLLQKYDGPTQKEKDALAKVQAELMERVKGYRDRCYPMPKDGCSCIEPRRVHRYETDEECRGKLPEDAYAIPSVEGPFKPSKPTEHQKEPTKSIGPGKDALKKYGVSHTLRRDICLVTLHSFSKTTSEGMALRNNDVRTHTALHEGNAFCVLKGPTTKERNAKAEVQEELMERVRGYRRRCYPMPVDGCRCDEILGSKRYATDAECRRKPEQLANTTSPIKKPTKPTGPTKEPTKVIGPSKAKLQKYGALGNDTDGPSTKERNAKAEVQEELMERVRGYRRKCYPMPVDGCRCDEIRGPKRYATDAECRRKPKNDTAGHSKEPIGTIKPQQNSNKQANRVCIFQRPSKPQSKPSKETRETVGPSKKLLQKYGAIKRRDKNGPTTKERNEKAAMQAELMDRVKGYREKCYPMPGPTQAAKIAKAAMQAQLMARVDGYREGCYPMPKDGCRCEENGKVKRYQRDIECKK
ncbi:hypothetical protein M513_00638 [Trichuris suis]|uniref:Uncharacterized protein n=1 Tax=Trichuris suis TaxID=68888 RepID=A0A085MMG6_9BILA|nr:hypothetical protein M513_00638 [Trichuris suis]